MKGSRKTLLFASLWALNYSDFYDYVMVLFMRK